VLKDDRGDSREYGYQRKQRQRYQQLIDAIQDFYDCLHNNN
jgi:hypothetical protein